MSIFQIIIGVDVSVFIRIASDVLHRKLLQSNSDSILEKMTVLITGQSYALFQNYSIASLISPFSGPLLSMFFTHDNS
jgi:hypothetical protein